jgi:antitoxin VapB
MNAPIEHPRGRRASVFKSNRNQAVRLPKELEFPDGVKQVYIHRHGRGLVITPVNDF